MVENQEELELGIGNEEAITLKPATVRVLGVRVDEVGAKKSKKVVCIVKHPDAKDNIEISSIKYESKGKLEVAGLWINKDSKGLIRKGSALATFMGYIGINQVGQATGKDIATIQDDKGYLVFKIY